eukprot:scaffold12.g8143.t1
MESAPSNQALPSSTAAELAVALALDSLSPRDVAGVACASSLLRSLADLPSRWRSLFRQRLGALEPLLEAAQPGWWAGQPWKARFAAAVGGAPFPAQIFNRERENEHEDFLLSCYDAVVSLSPASCAAAAGAPAGVAPPVGFSCEYLPMGSVLAVVESDVPLHRLRAAPAGSSPHAVFAGAAAGGLHAGQLVQVQWRGRQEHPFGWWLATVAAIAGDRLTLLFRQYPRSSAWHRVRAPLQAGKEAVLNGSPQFGYVGGVLAVTEAGAAEWQLQLPGPPHALLAPLPGAAGGEGESEEVDEEEDEFEFVGEDFDGGEEEGLAPGAGGEEEQVEGQQQAQHAPPEAPAEQQGTPAVAAAAGDGAGASRGARPEEAVGPAPAHAPPAQAVDMQLGRAVVTQQQALELPREQQE